jgi:hypothetical protein
MLVPDKWFNKESQLQVRYNPYDPVKGGRLLDDCACWDEIKAGIDVDERPTIAIFLPPCSTFCDVDVIAVLEEGVIVGSRGYQLKEGKTPLSKHPTAGPTFGVCFLGTGTESPSCEGWAEVPFEDFDNFLGVSGKFWAPQALLRLDLSGNETQEE